VGLALIAAGVVALLISAWQYRALVRYLWSTPFRPVAGIEAKAMTPVIAQTPLMAVVIITVFSILILLLSIFVPPDDGKRTQAAPCKETCPSSKTTREMMARSAFFFAIDRAAMELG